MAESRAHSSEHKAAYDLDMRVDELERELKALKSHPGIAAIIRMPHSHWGAEEPATEEA